MSKMFNNVNTSAGATVTEQLGLDSQIRELKFGSSFSPSSSSGGRNQQQGAFHTIKYDFKPASVDSTKTSTLEVGGGGQVMVSVPHYDNNGSTVFKGSTRPYTKECVLIIDKETGEIVLEKLSHNVQVKKTRQEGGGKSSSKGAAAVNPTPSTSDTPKPSSSSKMDVSGGGLGFPSSSSSSISKDIIKDKEDNAKRSNNSLSANNAITGGRRANSPLPSTSSSSSLPSSSRHSGLLVSNSAVSGRGQSPSPKPMDKVDKEKESKQHSAAAFDTLISKKHTSSSNSNALAMPSLTSIEDLLTSPKPAAIPIPSEDIPKPKPKPDSDIKTTTVPPPGAEPPQKHQSSGGTGLSDSSSDDSSSSSSSEDDDDDSSSDEDMEEVPIPGEKKDTNLASAGVPSMPSLDLFNSTGSMPSHLLSEDLELSESGSDSD